MSGAGRRGRLLLLVRHELRSVLRDRKTVMLSVLLPLVLMPLLLLLSRQSSDHAAEIAEARTHHYALAGDEAWLATQIELGLGALPERAPEAEPPAPSTVEPESAAPPKLERVQVDDPAASLEAGELDAYLLTREDTALGRVIELHLRANRETSSGAANALERVLEAARKHKRGELLAAQGFTLELDQLAAVETEDLALPGDSAGLALGKFLTVALVLLVLSGGQVVAADIMAGEKERGTLETLITTAAPREEIIASKLLTIAAVALGITALNTANLLVYVSFDLLPGAEGLAQSLSPFAIIVLMGLFVPVALLISAVLLLISGYAGSYKEAQLFAVPLQLVLMGLALAPLLPNLALRSAIILVPVANLSVAIRDILTGHFDWPLLAALVVINAGYAAWATRHGARALEGERLVAPSASESIDNQGGPAAFERHVLRWVAAIWALLFLSATWVPDLRAQLAVNLGALMLGGSLVMVRRYRLDLREAWALRKPPPLAWLAVAIGAPAGMIVAQGLFQLSSLVLPIPPEVVESFSDSLMPDIPRWQLIVMLTIVPGVCEEVFFRGMLLHGLRKRLGPVALCLVVGLVFGLFHVALFRLVTTGFLGVILAAVTLLSGSIFPAMVWHALNNLLALLAAEAGFVTTEISPGLYAGAVVALGLAFAILWRVRSPYPGLRGAPHVESPLASDAATRV